MKSGFHIFDWFFTAKTPRAPAKSRLRKMIDRAFYMVAPGEYARKPGGNLQHIRPRRFRRGRAWHDGKLTGRERFKFWTL